MNKKLIIAVLTSAAMLLSGCEKEEKDGGVTETTTVTTETVTEKEPEETTTATTIETTAETTVAETEPEIATEVQTEAVTTEKPEETDDSNKASDWNFISNAKTGNGFITYDPDDISKSITDVGMVEKSLSKEEMSNNGNDKNVVYKFTIQNAASAGDVNGMYMTTVVRDDGFYFVGFGKSDTHTLEDVLPYCSEGMEVEYWAFGELSDEGIPVLIPFVAGSEESGYYLIIPSLEQLGQDTSGMSIPTTPLGRAINGDATETTTSNTNNTSADDNSDGSIRMNINSVKNSDIITTAECEIMNNTGKNIYLTGTKLSINGVDYSDKFTAFIEIGKGKTVTDEIFIDDAQLYAGDKLEIIFMVGDNDTYSELGEIKFSMELETIS